jgi:RNA polymerase sigma factor (sigma-70 family)
MTADELCERYADRVYRFAAMVSSGGDAMDLAQAALEHAIRGLPRMDPDRGDIEGWLYRIVVNAARDAGRVARRQQALLDRARTLMVRPPAPSSGPPAGVADAELLNAIRQLAPRERAVIALRFGADLDHAAVGRALGISPAAAGMATRRAIAALRTRLEAGQKESRT